MWRLSKLWHPFRSLNENSSGIIYDRNMFKVQARWGMLNILNVQDLKKLFWSVNVYIWIRSALHHSPLVGQELIIHS